MEDSQRVFPRTKDRCAGVTGPLCLTLWGLGLREQLQKKPQMMTLWLLLLLSALKSPVSDPGAQHLLTASVNPGDLTCQLANTATSQTLHSSSQTAMNSLKKINVLSNLVLTGCDTATCQHSTVLFKTCEHRPLDWLLL